MWRCVMSPARRQGVCGLREAPLDEFGADAVAMVACASGADPGIRATVGRDQAARDVVRRDQR